MTSVVGSSIAVRESSGRPSGRCLGRFPCLDDRATRSALCLKLILVLLHVMFGGALFILDTELRRRTREHPWYTAIYLVLYLATLIQYFFTSYSSPGYVIDVMMAGSGTHATFANLSSFDQRQITTRNKNPSLSTQINSSVWLRQVMDLYPPGFSSSMDMAWHLDAILKEGFDMAWVLDMQLLPHYSASTFKHCHDCDKCVLQFDHHCAWLGTCIGKRNHCRFWWYIFEETMLCIWTGTLYIDLLVSKAMKSWWKDLIAIILIVILVFCFIFLILLLLFHSYLALTNQTTHEIMRRQRILYLRGFPSKVHPFSKGIYRNLIAFCCFCDDKHTLEAVPPVEDLEARAQPYTCIDIISCRCC